MSEDLLSRLQTDQNFKAEVTKNQQNYKALEQAAAYSQTLHVPPGMLKKVPNKEIYLYFGYMQPLLKKDMRQVAIYLVKNFKPEKNKPYTLVFFNAKTKDNYVLWNFRQTFSYMKIEDIALLKQLIVVKPYFYHKTMDWMTFGGIPKFIKARTRFIYSYKQLCQRLECNLHMLTENVPGQLYKDELPELYETTQTLSHHRINIQGQSRTQQQKNQMLQFQKSIMSMIMKPGNQINNLQDYEISPEGVPNILKMLVFYFDAHKEGLELEGLFRKSVSIDEEKETIYQILQKNYDYLLDVKNPHIIANLIKRFFSTLKIPIFTYDAFSQIMNDQGVKDKTDHLKRAFESMPELNKTTLTFIFSFLKQKVLKNEQTNKMNAQNISICFAPCIFRSEKPSVADLIYATKGVYYCKLLLTEFNTIFGTRDEQQKLYRNSYLQKKKTFEQNLKVGLDLTQSHVRNYPEEQQQKQEKAQKVSTKQQHTEEKQDKIQQKQQRKEKLRVQQETQTNQKQEQEDGHQNEQVNLNDLLLNAGLDRAVECRHSREVNLPQQQNITFQQIKQDTDPKDCHEQKHDNLELKQQ